MREGPTPLVATLAFAATLVVSAPSGGAMSAAAQEASQQSFGAFSALDGDPNVLILDGAIGATTGLDFRRATRARPDARLLLLNSGGGLVDVALLIAHEVRDLGMDTFVPSDAVCYSACTYVFLAGASRAVEGELGVHQLSNDANDLSSGQLILSDVLEALVEFGTPQSVVSLMLRTAPDDIHVFTEDELISYQINRGNPLAMHQVATAEPSPTPAPSAQLSNLRDFGPENVTVVPKTTLPGDETLGRSERILAVHEAGPLADTLLKNGFTQQMVAMIGVTLMNVLPSMNVPKGARLRILFGALRSSEKTLIPYRVSIYFPDPRTGDLEHAVTAALTDRGTYVLGLPPTPVVIDGVSLGDGSIRTEPNLSSNAGLSGKEDRARPPAD